MSARSRLGASAPLLILPAVLILAVFFVVPLTWTFMLSFVKSQSLGSAGVHVTFQNYVRFLTDSYYVKDLLWRTVRLSAVATFFAVVVGYVGALVISRAPLKWQPTLILLNMCPLWVNLVVRTLSLVVLLDRSGPVNALLVAFGIIRHPAQLLFNETAVLIGMVQMSVPFVVVSLYGVLNSIPRELEHAAMAVGANPIATFRRVTLPLSVPGILAGSILALGINMESFVVPILLGGGRVRVMSVAAYETATLSNNLPFAATIGVVLLVVTLAMLAVYQRLVSSLGRMSVALRSA